MFKLDHGAESPADFPSRSKKNLRDNTRTLVLAAVVAMAGGTCLPGCKKAETPAPETQAGQPAGHVLSDGTKAILSRLKEPVEIRFYALLDATYVPESVKRLAGRAEEMLSAFEKASGGRLTVKPFTSLSRESENAAAKDGLKALDLAQGNASFLGLAVACRDKQEVLPLLPEWEPAMESDLARAIARVSVVQTPAKLITEDPNVAERITAEVNRIIPDLKATPAAEGIRLLRESAMNEFKAAAAEMKQQIEAAQQRLSEAQSGQSEAEKAAALKRVQQVQLEQGEKLKEITARLQDEIEKFQQLKKAAGN